jgi:thioredoxin reductase (NADPH)
MSKNKHDIIIIGGGPIGLACGIEAEKRKLSYLILEKGCLVNSIFNYPANMTFFSTSERLEIGEVPFISHGVKPTRTEALEYYRRVKVSWNLKINLYEKVESISGSKGNFKIDTSKSSYTAVNVIICTGYYDYPNLMNVKGEDLKKVKHYYDEPHPYAERKIVIVGGGNSAVDVALETYRRGSDVTMVVKKNELDKGVKYWVRPDIENRLKEGSIKSFFSSTIAAIRENEVDIETHEGIVTIENDFVLAMTGYHPDFEFLKKAGVTLRTDSTMQPEFNEETFETNEPGIYLAGVVCGGMETGKWFIENSRYHAEYILEHIASQ